jgi:hypothetical protein
MKVKNSFQAYIIPLSLLFLILSSGTVFSIEWTVLSTTKDGNVLSYDKGSVRQVNPNIYRLWERILYADENVKENVKTTVFIREINCQESQHRIISIIDYDVNGEKLFSGSDDQTEWSAIPPETPIDDLRKTVCPKKDDKSSIKKLYRYLFP